MNDFLSKISALEKTTSWNDEDAYTFIHQGVSELLSHDVQSLFQLLYRIDVKESLVNEVFKDAEHPENISQQITVLIIRRLKQKAEIRRNYSSQ